VIAIGSPRSDCVRLTWRRQQRTPDRRRQRSLVPRRLNCLPRAYRTWRDDADLHLASSRKNRYLEADLRFGHAHKRCARPSRKNTNAANVVGTLPVHVSFAPVTFLKVPGGAKFEPKCRAIPGERNQAQNLGAAEIAPATPRAESFGTLHDNHIGGFTVSLNVHIPRPLADA